VKQKSSQKEIGSAQNRAEYARGHQVESMKFELEIKCLAGGLAVVQTLIKVGICTSIYTQPLRRFDPGLRAPKPQSFEVQLNTATPSGNPAPRFE
jgi:hypothetical protein